MLLLRMLAASGCLSSRRGLLPSRFRYLGLLLWLLAELDSASPGNGIAPQIAPVATLRGAADNALVYFAARGTGSKGGDVSTLCGLVHGFGSLGGEYEAIGSFAVWERCLD